MKLELPDSLTADGVVLRRLRADDAPAYAAAFRDDPELGRLLGMEEDPAEERVRTRVAEGRSSELAIAGPGDAFAGSVVLHSLDDTTGAARSASGSSPARAAAGSGRAPWRSRSRGRSGSSICCAWR